jgi:hypothetical protein
MPPIDYFKPLSVRQGNWRVKLRWQISMGRERLALWIAPWVKGGG